MNPIVFFDLETTGTDVVNDRIVQLAAVKVTGLNGEEEEKNVLINPGKPISKEASEVHGITDEMVKDKPKFAQYAKALFSFLEGCDLGGFNIIQFDIPILAEEFARCGIDWPAKGTKFYDAFHVFREKEKRDLSSAVKFYCNESHDDAHDALADVRATIKVFNSQCFLYPDLGTVEEYAAFCVIPGAIDLAGKIVLNEKGEAVYNLGKDKGKSVKQNPGFGQWMLNQSFSTNTKSVVRSLINS
jgi:DNA polymerase-3 subunit epsilon